MCFLPDTPVFLINRGREKDARNALQRLRGKRTNVEPELQRMINNKKQQQANELVAGAKKTNQFRELLKAPVLKPFGISMAIMFFQQVNKLFKFNQNLIQI